MDINTLISKALLGQMSSEEQKELLTRLESDGQLARRYRELLAQRDLTRRYAQWASVDKDSAKSAMLRRRCAGRRQATMTVVLKSVIGLAAAGLVLLVATKLMHAPKPVAPVLSQAVEQAIIKSQQTGQSEATLIVSGSMPVDVSSADKAQHVAQELTAQAENAGDGETPTGTIQTSHSKEFWMTLDDGTRVHLNQGSSLTYPLKFSNEERRVSLRGEAYFFVAHDTRRKFVVETQQSVVVDYGTEFDIKTTDRGQTQVVLIKGKVGVTARGGQETMMQPGTQATIEAGRPVRLSAIDTTPYLAWNTGQYHFDGSTLEELMTVVGKWYDIEVGFGNNTIRKVRFSGSLDRYENMEPTLHAISAITGASIRVEGRKIIIE